MENNTGIVRRLDRLGRVVIPKEIRRTFDIKPDDGFEIYVDGNEIALRRYEPFCVFCGSSDGIVDFGGRHICRSCILKIQHT